MKIYILIFHLLLVGCLSKPEQPRNEIISSQILTNIQDSSKKQNNPDTEKPSADEVKKHTNLKIYH